MSAPVRSNLRKLRTIIDKAVEGEENLTVYIYISDELDEPIKLQTGAGDNELLIDIEEEGIEVVWTKKTWWKKTKDFFKEAAEKILKGLSELWGHVKSIAGTAMKAITWFG